MNYQYIQVIVCTEISQCGISVFFFKKRYKHAKFCTKILEFSLVLTFSCFFFKQSTCGLRSQKAHPPGPTVLVPQRMSAWTHTTIVITRARTAQTQRPVITVPVKQATWRTQLGQKNKHGPGVGVGGGFIFLLKKCYSQSILVQLSICI